MRRRRYLALLGTAATPAVAGCSGDGQPTETGTPTPVPTPSREDLVAEYRSQLDERDINVQTIEWDGAVLRLEYYSDAGSISAFREEVQHVAVAVANSYGRYTRIDVDRFETTAYAYNDDVLGEFYVESEWVDQLGDREISEDEYLQRVRDTVS
ncbi:MAG: hypothetical protein ACI8U4_001596 [Natronomonas sp.]|jgi:hypothetical protein